MANYLCETYIMQWYYCKGQKKRNFCLTYDKRYMYEAHYFFHICTSVYILTVDNSTI